MATAQAAKLLDRRLNNQDKVTHKAWGSVLKKGRNATRYGGRSDYGVGFRSESEALKLATRVFVVEDDAFYSQHITELLRDYGVEALRAASAEEALSRATADYDAALVDVMLPNDPEKSGITNEESRGGFSAGIAVARRLIEKNPKLKVGIISSDVGGGDAEARAFAKGFPFVRKSDGRRALIEVLNSLGLLGARLPPLAFIVHGHDESTLLELKNYVQKRLEVEAADCLEGTARFRQDDHREVRGLR